MKRIIIILIVVAAVGGYFTYAYFQGKAEEKAKQINVAVHSRIAARFAAVQNQSAKALAV